MASGMIECLNKMERKLPIIHTDDEGALNKEAIQEHTPFFVKEPCVLLKICCVRGLKPMRKCKPNIQWPRHILEALLNC